MSVVVTISDQSLSGERTGSLKLSLLTSNITLRELIRRRVYEEVQEYNAAMPEYFKGLVEPTEAERVLNGYRIRKGRKIDWEEQFKKAVTAFEQNGFFVLVDDRQAADLDEEITLKIDTDIAFVKLVPLVGG
jgi:hypothetical protein